MLWIAYRVLPQKFKPRTLLEIFRHMLCIKNVSHRQKLNEFLGTHPLAYQFLESVWFIPSQFGQQVFTELRELIL